MKLTRAPQGRVSAHLACLRWCGYVTARQDGHQVFYRVTDSRVRELLRTALALLADNCERIETCTIIDPRARTKAGLQRRRLS